MTKQQVAKATPAFFGAGHEYLFYIEGLNREEWVVAGNEREAHSALWEALDEFEKNRVVQMECIDERNAE